MFANNTGGGAFGGGNTGGAFGGGGFGAPTPSSPLNNNNNPSSSPSSPFGASVASMSLNNNNNNNNSQQFAESPARLALATSNVRLKVQAAVQHFVLNTLEAKLTEAWINKYPELSDQVQQLRNKDAFIQDCEMLLAEMSNNNGNNRGGFGNAGNGSNASRGGNNFGSPQAQQGGFGMRNNNNNTGGFENNQRSPNASNGFDLKRDRAINGGNMFGGGRPSVGAFGGSPNSSNMGGGFGAAKPAGNMFGGGSPGGGFGGGNVPSSSPLLSSIEDGDLAAFTKLLEGGADATGFNTVLNPICQWHRVEMLQLLDTKGIDLIGARSSFSSSLLHTCAYYGAVACATFLLNKGIDHTARGGGGTALDCCRKNGELKPNKGGGTAFPSGSEPSPSRKQIEQLIFAKMTTEEKSQDAQKQAQKPGGFSFS